jgi:Flp pilus assembly protein TadD
LGASGLRGEGTVVRKAWLVALFLPAALRAGESAPGERGRRLLGEALQAEQSAGPEGAAEVVKRFRAAAEEAPAWGIAQLDLGVVLDREGDVEGATRAYRAALAAPGAGEQTARAAAERIAALALLRGDAGAARSIAQQGAQRYPSAPWPLELRAEVELAAGNAAAAQQAARTAVARSPKSVPALCALARAHAGLGAPGTARLLALRAAEGAPHDARPNLLLAGLARKRDDPAAELAALRAATAADPGSAEAALLLGKALHARGLGDEALAEIGRAAQLDPRSASAHLALGALLAQHKRPARAAEELELSARLAPRAPEPHLELSRLRLEAEEDAGSALAEAQTFVQLSPVPPPPGHPVYALMQRSEQALKAAPRAPVVQKVLEKTTGDDK